MKKILLFILILLILFGGYIVYDKYLTGKIPKLKTEEKIINIDELYIYGNHLNLHGKLVDDDNLQLVFYNGDFLEYEINIDESYFNLSDKINKGILLEEIPIGTYYMFIRSKYKLENGKDGYKYYILNNATKYDETVYYTFSNTNNKIIINSDNDYKTLMANVSENTDKVYDVVIDPGHGGMDSGATKNGYSESDLTLKIALNLKEKLEKNGVKVKLTREDGQLTSNEKLPDYGVHGRAVIPYESKAKYLFSIHMNSNSVSSVNGLEIYAPANINYDFAKQLANNIIEKTNINYSNNKINLMFSGIYSKTFTEELIKESQKEYENKDMKAYDITTKSNYFFIIRETGGIVTGAYVDDRNEDIAGNPYYNSNVGTEAYLLELGYLSNKSDLNNMVSNMNLYTDAIADTFMTIFS